MKAPACDPGDFCVALGAESALFIPEIDVLALALLPGCPFDSGIMARLEGVKTGAS